MAFWLFILFLISAVLLVYFRKQPALPAESFVNGPDAQMTFSNSQEKYFADTADAGIFINSGINLTGVNDALRVPDVYLSNSPDRDYKSYFTVDPTSRYTAIDSELCRNALHPNNLPRRTASDISGCGWWYANDEAQQSSGVFGTPSNPLFRTNLPANGEWYWDLEAAAKKEDIKRCRRIRNCSVISADGIANNCAFCERRGHAIPINSNGTEKYPNDSEGSCGETLIREASNCPSARPRAVKASNGVSCGTYGRPSPDGTRRLYTQSECDALGGTFSSGGECTRASGGSYSFDCASLNNPAALRTGRSICTPLPSNRLSQDCLLSLGQGVGLTPTGVVQRLISRNAAPNEMERLAIRELSNAGVNIPTAALGEGSIDTQSAVNIYNRIYNAMTTGATENVRNAARFLAVGGVEYDQCNIALNRRGPFETPCLQRAFRQAGCQPAGSMYPNERSAVEYSGMTWQEINDRFTGLKTQMKSTNPDTQGSATKQCLGIELKYKDVPNCKEPGFEYLYYSWNASEVLIVNGVRYAAFVSSDKHSSGFKKVDVGGGLVGNSKRWDNVALKIRSNILPSTAINGQIELWTDDGVRILQNGNMILNRWWDMPPTRWVTNFNAPANQPQLLEIFWYENGGGALLEIRGVIDKINPASYLPFPKMGPVIAFDFYRGRLDDIHSTVRSTPSNVSFQTREGRNGAFFGATGSIQILNPLRYQALKTITAMVYCQNVTTTPRILNMSMTNNSFESNTLSIGMNGNSLETSFIRNESASIRSFADGAIPLNRWTHIAFTWHQNYMGFDIYINGVLRETVRNPGLYGNNSYPDTILKYCYIGGFAPYRRSNGSVLNFGPASAFDGTMAWVHMYDYVLTSSQIREEMRYWDNANYNTPIHNFNTNMANVFGNNF